MFFPGCVCVCVCVGGSHGQWIVLSISTWAGAAVLPSTNLAASGKAKTPSPDANPKVVMSTPVWLPGNQGSVFGRVASCESEMDECTPAGSGPGSESGERGAGNGVRLTATRVCKPECSAVYLSPSFSARGSCISRQIRAKIRSARDAHTAPPPCQL